MYVYVYADMHDVWVCIGVQRRASRLVCVCIGVDVCVCIGVQRRASRLVCVCICMMYVYA
jgi:hypothetical protein